MSWLGNILAPPVEVAETADVLLHRLQDAAKVEARRRAIKDLKEIAPKNAKAGASMLHTHLTW